MSRTIPAPDPQSLLPPLLACLPVAFASARPPPVLLPLLSPILRQRIHIFTSTNTSSHDSWLRLLCWDASQAETVKETVENAHFEPHPSSGEVEVGELDPIRYKRLDAETLKAQISMADWSLTAVYLWCTGSEEGDGWRLAEIVPYDVESARDGSDWSASVSEADAKMPIQSGASTAAMYRTNGGRLSVAGQTDNDDDDYWAQYDRSPNSRTPARKASIQPSSLGVINGGSEDDYYARYGEVQPAADNYDPDEQHEEMSGLQTIVSEHEGHNVPASATAQRLALDTSSQQHHDQTDVVQPVPSSPGSSTGGSDMVARLERTAEKYSSSEIAIKQHISYSVKSMYRLAKGAGMSRREFEDMVHRELETLSLLDRDD